MDDSCHNANQVRCRSAIVYLSMQHAPIVIRSEDDVGDAKRFVNSAMHCPKLINCAVNDSAVLGKVTKAGSRDAGVPVVGHG